MNRFQLLFGNKSCSIIGMIHLNALPGTPRFEGSVQKIVDKALKETDIYLNNNVDGICIENMNDIPYIQRTKLKPETTATMTRVCTEIKQKMLKNSIPCGVQVLAGGNEEALAIANACNLNFIRVEGFVFSHVADEGLMNACAGTLLRYRKYISADDVLVFADIKKKHSSHSITSDISVVETAKAAEFFLADGVILTGTATGNPANAAELTDVKKNVKIPVIIGSGVTESNLQDYLQADALIIGSAFKKGGHWMNDLNSNAVASFMNKLNSYI